MTQLLTFRKVMLFAVVAMIVAVGIAYAVEIQRSVGGSLVVGKVETAEETILLYSQLTPTKINLTELNFGAADVTAFGLFRQRPSIPVYVKNGGDVAFALGVEVTDVRVNGTPVGNALALDIRSILGPTPTPAPTATAVPPVTAAPTATASPAATPTPAYAAAPGGAFEELDFGPLTIATPTPVATVAPVPAPTATPTPTPRPPLPTIAVIRPGQVVGFQVSLRFLRTPQELGVKTDDRITFTAVFRAFGPVAPVTTPTPTPAVAPIRIRFDEFPGGSPIAADMILSGDEFASKGIRLAGAPEGDYCADGTLAAILAPPHASPLGNSNYLTTSTTGDVVACNTVPVAITFVQPVRNVSLSFVGASLTYTMKVYDANGNLITSMDQAAVCCSGLFEVAFTSSSANISRVTFGKSPGITAVYEISYFQ